MDTVLFGSDIASDQLWFRQAGNSLEISVLGGSDTLTVANWYLGPAYRTERFVAGDGKTLGDSKVPNLVQAMAAFAPPAASQSVLTAQQQAALNPVLAANWQ